MSSPEQRKRLADLLQQVTDGTMSAEAALKVTETWSDMPWKEREVNVAWHTLKHWEIDEDIRERDPEYAFGLKQALIRHIHKLRTS